MSGTDTFFERLYAGYKEKVRGYIVSKGVAPADQEDVFQEIFIKAYRRRSTYSAERGSLSTWIYTISKTCVMDYFRGQKAPLRLDAAPGDPGAVPADTPVPLVYENPDDALINEENLGVLADALERLSPRERQIIVLNFYAEKPLSHIAKEMGLSAANVRMIKSRALKKLEKELVESIGD